MNERMYVVFITVYHPPSFDFVYTSFVKKIKQTSKPIVKGFSVIVGL